MSGRNRYLDWRHKHYGKRTYPSQQRAWLAIGHIWLRQQHLDSLVPYICRHTARADAGETGPPHVHIGHGRHTPQARARYQLDRKVVWPFYRARARWRQRQKM